MAVEEIEDILTANVNLFRNSVVEEWLNDKRDVKEVLEEIEEYSALNIQKVRCPKCKNEFDHNMRNHTLDYFECLNCKQKLALSKKIIRKKVRYKLYIDDVEHMGFMTSGPGGY